MAFTGNYVCTSFKQELLQGIHNLGAAGDTFKLALYDNNASFTAATTIYTAANEVSGSGYSAGGSVLTNVNPSASGTTAFSGFEDLTISAPAITARGALIYNSTAGGNAVLILDFGLDRSSTGGNFTVNFPTADPSNAILRIA